MTRQQIPPEHLSVEQCNELADAFLEDAASLPVGPHQETLKKLAESYRELAAMKIWVLGKVN